MAVRAVFFDMDGTLVDSNDFHVMAWKEAFTEAGADVGEPAIRTQIGKGADMLIPSLMPGADKATQQTIAAAHARIFDAKYLDRVKPFAGARELLARVHVSSQKIVLASSTKRQRLGFYIDLLDANDLVTEMVGGDEVSRTKPAPDIFSRALEKVAPIVAAEMIGVGDSPYDAEAAAKCGIRTIALRSGGFTDDILRSAGSMAIYDDVTDLLTQFALSPLADQQ